MAVIDLKEKEFFREGEQICVTESVYKPSIEEHSHAFYEIAYITNGHGYHSINGKNNYISEGSLVLITPGSVHNYSGEGNLRWINILFEPTAVSRSQFRTENADNFMSKVLLTDSFHFNILSLNNNADTIIFEMLEEYKKGQSGYQEVLSGYLGVLLVKLFRTTVSDESHSLYGEHDTHALKETVISLLKKGENIRLESLAQRAFLSPRSFQNLFRKEVGETLTQFVRHYKIDLACRLLKETDLSVSEIMEEIHMNDTKNFFNSFRKYTGTTPKKYRDSP